MYLVRKFNTSLFTFSQTDATHGNWNIPRNCAGERIPCYYHLPETSPHFSGLLLKSQLSFHSSNSNTPWSTNITGKQGPDKTHRKAIH